MSPPTAYDNSLEEPVLAEMVDERETGSQTTGVGGNVATLASPAPPA